MIPTDHPAYNEMDESELAGLVRITGKTFRQRHYLANNGAIFDTNTRAWYASPLHAPAIQDRVDNFKIYKSRRTCHKCGNKFHYRDPVTGKLTKGKWFAFWCGCK